MLGVFAVGLDPAAHMRGRRIDKGVIIYKIFHKIAHVSSPFAVKLA
jgi:hypothetical protein